eukprot:m.298956 g.298956  ORF g.298956 m.298956 type:complete len:54 (+) comp13997_c0_seq1:1695-1856(+)
MCTSLVGSRLARFCRPWLVAPFNFLLLSFLRSALYSQTLSDFLLVAEDHLLIH